MREKTLNKKLNKRFTGQVSAALENGVMTLSGKLESWDDIIGACFMAVDKKRYHVVNDIEYTGGVRAPMRLPGVSDSSLEGASPDVLVIGGGISGTAIARELTRYDLSVLLVDKEPDVAMQATGRNDGEVHPGVDLGRGSLKQRYVIPGNRMMDVMCRELDVPFERVGQYVCFTEGWLYPAAWLYAMQRRYVCGVTDTRIVGRKAMFKAEPRLNPEFKFAMYNPMAGSVCPYGLAIACAENAVMNGAKVSLNTAVTGIKVEDGRITCVYTNRGTLHPRVVINAAGVFAEDIAKMAEDRFYSIHPRRGTNSILDKKAERYMHRIASIKRLGGAAHTKGGGMVRTAHHNVLVGPDAVETPQKEDVATRQESVDNVFNKQRGTVSELSERDIITYCTGVRACTFEEDFIIEKGRATHNLVHCAGIQSPGLTAAPAFAPDVARLARELLEEDGPVSPNPNFDPRRRGIPVLRELPPDERGRLIQKNPDYGVIVCRCEEISKGEITDALDSPLCVPTVDGIKKRLRPGMGRCQGGFCSPLVQQIIAEHLNIPLEQVKKGYDGAYITMGPTKGGK